MSGTQVSSFYPVNQLLADNAQQITNYYAPRRNELLIQKGQQEIGAQEMEYAARAAAGLLSLNDETAMAAAYPGAIAEGQRYGFLKNAPSVFPGVDRLRQIASYGVSAEKQYEQAGVRSAADAIRAGLSVGTGTGTGTIAAPGGGAATVTTPGPIEGDAQARAFAVRDGLIRRGMDPETATAFAANALHESSANPNVGRGDRGSSAGLFQWRDDRERAYIAKYGHSPQNAPLDEQLDFVMHELHGSESVARDRINTAQGVADKAAQVSQAYLRPKDMLEEMRRRSATATQLAGALPNVTPGMTDKAWLDQMARQYPSLGGPNANPNQPNLGGQTPAPYQTASLTPTPPPSGATPAAPVQPAATTTAQTATPAQPAPAAPAAALPAPPPPLGADGLNAQQRQTVNGMLSTARTPAQLQQVQAQMQTYRDHNDTVQRQYQADVRQAQKDAEAAATAQQTAADRAGAAQRDQARLEVETARYNDARAKDAREVAPTLDRIAPKIMDGTATESERREYSRAMETGFLKPHMELINGAQVLVPGRLPPGYPAWDYQPAKPGDTPVAPKPSDSTQPMTIASAPAKEPPQKVAETLIEDANSIRKIDQTLDALAKHESAVGPVYNIPLSQTIGDWRSPDSAKVRGLIADIGSLKLHDRSGAAISATEWPRLRPFIPSVTDTPAVIREKLDNFQREYLGILNDTYQIYGPSSGFRKLQPVEDALARQRPETNQKPDQKDRPPITSFEK